MEPQDLADVIEAALDAALAAGLDPDAAELSFAFDAKSGDVSIKSTSGAGKSFDLVVPAADIASALDGDMAEDGAEAAPADAMPAEVAA